MLEGVDERYAQLYQKYKLEKARGGPVGYEGPNLGY
jgi:hypothetical protein